MTGAGESLLLVERNGRKKSIKGSNLNLLIQDDMLLINRDDKVQKIRWVDAGTLSDIQDTDLFACWKDGVNYHMTGVTFKGLYPLPEMVIDYFDFNTSKTERPLPIEDGDTVQHEWKVSNAKEVYVDGVGWHYNSTKHERRENVTYSGPVGKEFLYTLTATDFAGNVKTDEIKGVVVAPKVQITRWDWPAGPQSYGQVMTGWWATKNAEKLEREGYKVYANFSGDTASGTETWRFYPIEDKWHSITGEAYSKYDDSTIETQAWVWVTGLSINPSTIFDYVTNGKVGGSFRPKVNISNENKIYSATGTEVHTTWRLLGLTKGNEEASFGTGSSNQINETTDREPRVHFKKKTKNGSITLQCECVNTDNYEYSRPEIKFTVGL
jgi:hypothetical protein